MKKIYSVFIFISFTAFLQAQTVHEVEVFNFGFEPATLTIEPGDIVEWTNTGGFHNVNGSTQNFPENPESFGNATGTSPWTYSFTFTLEGTYDYQCDVHPAQMQGSIVVSGNTSSTENVDAAGITVYPSPADDEIRFSGLEAIANTAVLEIFDITGKMALKANFSTESAIDISELNGGVYLFNLLTQDGERFAGKIFVK